MDSRPGVSIYPYTIAHLPLRKIYRGSDDFNRVPAIADVYQLGTALVAGPLVWRTLALHGTPMPFSHEDPWMHATESGQPPGVRTLRRYLRVPFALFEDAKPLAPHLLSSVWGSLYANVWTDNYRESDRDRSLELARGTPAPLRAMLCLGLLPTSLALAGAGLALGDVARGRRASVYVPLLWLVFPGHHFGGEQPVHDEVRPATGVKPCRAEGLELLLLLFGQHPVQEPGLGHGGPEPLPGPAWPTAGGHGPPLPPLLEERPDLPEE